MILAGLLACVLSLTKSSFCLANEGATKLITEQLEQLFKASKNVNAPGDEKAKARGMIESSMDWDKIAEMCLGPKQAKKNAGKNIKEFRNILKDVVINTAYSRLDKFWNENTNYKYDKFEFKGNTCKVPAKFMVKGEAFILEYFFSKKGNQWLIYDISYEDIRYSTNISEQLEAFLREKSFAELLDKLRKRRDELTEDNKTKKS